MGSSPIKSRIRNSILAKRERQCFGQRVGPAAALLGPMLFLCLVFPGSFSYPSDTRGEGAIRREKLLKTIQDLAAPQMEGRAAGSAGEAKARQYIAREFRRIGLQPSKALGSYFQRFEIATGLRLGRDNRLVLEIGGEKRNYRPKTSFNPFGFSDEGEISGGVVFAGYGISAPELRYDDYAGLDVKDKIVLVMTHEPQETNPRSPFRSPEAFRYTEIRYKVWNAREHGAKGIIIFTDPNNHRNQKEQLFALRGGGSASAGIIAVNVLREVAETLLRRAEKRLSDLQRHIDETLSPSSVQVADTRVHLKVDLIRKQGHAENVIGVLPGGDPNLRDEAIVLGAHYDGLGRGGEGSLAPDLHGKIHPGADDNASGVAGIISLAEAFARGGAKRTLIFVAFSAEELGVLGSAAYVKHPPWPLEKTYAMINLDMIGRPKSGRLYVLGVDSAKEFRPLLNELAAASGLKLALSGDAFGPSDHTSFYARGKLVLMFHTGPHSDYHRPSDTAQKIDAEGLEKVVRFTFKLAAELAQRGRGLTFGKTGGEPPPSREEKGGYGAYFGSIPDFSESDVPGVRLSGVRPGSPAEKAGLRTGDTIVKLGGTNIRNLHDLLFALRSKRAGEEVEVEYLREGKTFSSHATLQEQR